MEEIIEKDLAFARDLMNRVWKICQDLQKRRISIFDAANKCCDECEDYTSNMLLNLPDKPTGLEPTE